MPELKRLCSDYIERLAVNDAETEEIAKRTAGQSMDVSGEWHRQRLTASVFGEICKRKASTGFTKLTTRLLYGKYRETKGMRYGNCHDAQSDYLKKIQVSSPLSSVSTTGIHIYIDTKECWPGASPDGIVTDPNRTNRNVL